LTNWEKRQYVSDSSTVRVRKHRDKQKEEKKQDETLQKRSSNGTEQNRTEQKQSKAIADDSLFDRFYVVYPKKVARAAAIKAFRACKPNESLVETMIAALKLQIDSPDWQKEGGKYIPNPATWLNGERWKDQLSSTEKQTQQTWI
jgi:hypothetical protein